MNHATITHEQMDRILYKATLAPSPHNAQSWKIRFDGKKLVILSDENFRIMRELDPEEKEGSIALGAVVENIVLAAYCEGFHANISWFPDRETDRMIAEVTFVSAEEVPSHDQPSPSCLKELHPYLERRTMNRSKYRRTPVPEGQLQELQKIAAEEGLELCIVTDKTRIKRLADLAGEAGRFKFTHEPTHRELYHFLRFSAREASATRDGLPLEHFNIPASIARFGKIGMDWRFVRWLNRLGYHRVLAFMQETMLVNSAPAVCLLKSKDGRRLSYLQGGRVLQRIWLAAAKHQLAVQPHSAIADLGYARLAGYHESISEVWQHRINSFSERLRNIFSVQDEGELHVVNVFRIGYPTKTSKKRSLRRHMDDIMEIMESDMNRAQANQFYQELTKRNFPFISLGDQQRLRKRRIAVAGCGSIGGASLEVLARMGAERFILAEPDVFELNNLNRQNATRHDIGMHKAQVLLERIRQINPHIKGHVLYHGVTPENVQYFVGSSAVIIDGVDITEKNALNVKIMLHEEAWRQQKTVISGYDIAGTQLLRIYDYGSGKVRPLNGRFHQVNGEQITPLAFLSKVISPLDLPVEMLSVTRSMIKGSQESIPQLGPTANLFGVLSAWAVLDVLSGRPVRHKILIDIPNTLRPTGRSIITSCKRMMGIIKLKLLLNKTMKARKRSQIEHNSESVKRS